MNSSNSSLILASSSPRRKDLLSRAGILIEIKVSDIDETPRKKEAPKRMVARLSESKAMKVVSELELNAKKFQWVLAADTTVVSNRQKNLGKPESRTEAIQMISELQGTVHHVLTGYTIVKVRAGKVVKKVTRVVRTDVYFRKLNRKEIEAYVDRGESMDKAGAYGAQSDGMVLVEKIKGSYTNVVGLPVAQVISDLKSLGFMK